jgi:heme-degrading monooxygenase HmoA
MNYREWLLYRAQQYETSANEPEVLRYSTWRNYQAVRDWMRRADAAHVLQTGGHRIASEPLS